MIADGIDTESEPPEITDFGFSYPVTHLARVVSILKRSNFCFWPDAGGFNDQCEYLIDDVLTWLAIERREEWEKELPEFGDENRIEL